MMVHPESERDRQSGKLVSLEGDVKFIATQLQLLPPSQKILILSALQDQLSSETEWTFDARSFVRRVYSALLQRTEEARSFLQNSTNAHPKLVFMNGGSVSARAICLARISERLTNGDVGGAESIFNVIVKDGVAGLLREEVQTDKDDINPSGMESTDETRIPELLGNLTLRAMMAAESLDRATAALQTDDIVEEHVIALRDEMVEENDTNVTEIVDERASSRGLENPSFQGETFTGQGNIVRTVVSIPEYGYGFHERRSTFGTPDTSRDPHTIVATSRTTGQAHPTQDDMEQMSAEDASACDPPNSSVSTGKTQVSGIDSATGEHSIRSSPFHDAACTDSTASTDSRPISVSTWPRMYTASHSELRRKSWTDVDQGRKSDVNGLSSSHSSPSLTTLQRKSKSASDNGSGNSPPRLSDQRDVPRSYVSRGTDAEGISSVTLDQEEAISFVPVFDLSEDLVIQFTDTVVHNDIFECVIRSYKDGNYPILPPEPVKMFVDPASENPPSPKSMQSEEPKGDQGCDSAYLRPDADSLHQSEMKRRSFDPYSTREYLAGYRREGTPSDLTPPPTSKLSDKFLTFSPVNPSDIIGVQNAFRKVLNSQFPPSDGYSQHYYATTPEEDRVWKPIFRNDERFSVGIDGRNVDQIIALGAESDVSEDFSFQVSGLIERLGIKRSGQNKSGKLDLRYIISGTMDCLLELTNLRYLINIVMSSFTSNNAHPAFNPLTNPSLLATLLVPHLDSYLAMNTGTRLLVLQYPANHLSTVFALRKLLGPDLFCIARIINPLSHNLPTPSQPRTPVSSNPLSDDAIAFRNAFHLNASQRSQHGDIPLAIIPSQETRSGDTPSNHSATSNHFTPSSKVIQKADFVLTSAASDSEVAAFLSSIWRYLMEKSSFYMPEPEPRPKVVEQFLEKPTVPPVPPIPDSVRPSSRSRRSQFQKHDNKTTLLTPNRNSLAPVRPREKSLARSEKSYAESVMTTRSERDRKWENFYIGEEDSDDDDWDRMILGRAGVQKFVPEDTAADEENQTDSQSSKGGDKRRVKLGFETPAKSTGERGTLSKKKALKWLGLA